MIFDAHTSKIRASKKALMKRECASLTKMMTLYTVVTYLEKEDIDPSITLLRVKRAAASVQGTSANLKEGDILSVTELLYGMMLPSGNDAAYQLAEHFGKIFFKEKYSKQVSSLPSSLRYEQTDVKFFLA
jgi:D-alanyl-D-alanine carboxypeptidase (penicillin-binding protein 5/6)